METATKKWYASKAIWAGVITVLVASYNAASAQFGLPPIPDFVFGILAALGIYGRVASTTVIKK